MVFALRRLLTTEHFSQDYIAKLQRLLVLYGAVIWIFL
jgi:hypothetical protein